MIGIKNNMALNREIERLNAQTFPCDALCESVSRGEMNVSIKTNNVNKLTNQKLEVENTLTSMEEALEECFKNCGKVPEDDPCIESCKNTFNPAIDGLKDTIKDIDDAIDIAKDNETLATEALVKLRANADEAGCSCGPEEEKKV